MKIRTRLLSSVLLAGAAALGLASRAAHGDPVLYEVPREEPLPAGTQSFVMSDLDGITIMAAPGIDGPIAGRSLPGASFPILETRRARGCRRLWLRIGPDAWMCGDHGALSRALPHPTPVANPDDPDDPLPWPYAFTSRNDTRAYRSVAAALRGSSDPSDFQLWESNWGFAIRAITGVGAGRVVRTYGGWYLRRSDMYRAVPSRFAGGSFRELAGDEPHVPFGWVAGAGAVVYPEPRERNGGEALPRLSLVRVYATRQLPSGRVLARVGPDRWVRADKLRWISPEPPPAGIDVAARERWIDVDLTSQTLLAYEGAEPVYATMVSTGRGQFATPPGVFRIHSRYITRTMDNTEAAQLASHFRLGDVPYVQFFDSDRGLHGVYWHEGFGWPRSHGCVNLAPRDAQFLFGFTTHPLPDGWASRTVPPGEGTVVRVRGRFPEG